MATNLVEIDQSPGCGDRQRDVGRREGFEIGVAINGDRVVQVTAVDRDLAQVDVAAALERTDVGYVTPILQATQLDRLLRGGTGIMDADVVDRQIMVITEDQNVAALAAAEIGGGVVLELAMLDG